MEDNNSSSSSKSYVGKVQEETQRYVRDLLDDNEKLRAITLRLKAQNLSLVEELTLVRAQLDHHRKEQDALQLQLASLEQESGRFAAQYTVVEQQNTNLANLYVASHQLHGSVDRATVLQSIQEIVANLIGSEEMAVFQLTEDGSALSLAASFGIDTQQWQRVKFGEGKIGRSVVENQLYVSPTGTADEEGLTACIPLRIDDTTVGAVAIFRLLAHKPAIEDVDREMFDLLGMHAAASLHCATLHERATALA